MSEHDPKRAWPMEAEGACPGDPHPRESSPRKGPEGGKRLLQALSGGRRSPSDARPPAFSAADLGALFLEAPVPLGLVTPEGRILACNGAMAHLCGYSKGELLESPIEALHEDPQRHGEIVDLLTRHGRVEDLEVGLVRKDGSRFKAGLTVTPFRGGRRPALVVALRDVSAEIRERVEAQEALAGVQDQLLQAQKMGTLGVLVAGVAHEINNPVNQIMFNTPLLQRIWQDVEPAVAAWCRDRPRATFGGLSFDFLRENLPQLLSSMDMAADRIARIVSDLKQFSRSSHVDDKTPVQLNTGVKNAIRLAHTTLRKAGTRLTADLEEQLPLMEGNLQKLEQIVLNLLINASQAMEGRPGHVRVRTRLEDDRLLLSVSDNGRGIPDGIAEKVFDPFFTDRPGEGGTGLGLSVTDNLVKAHAGKIRFESGRGEGTTFFVSFPRLEG